MARFEEKALLQAARELGHDVVPINVKDAEFWITEPSSNNLDFVIQRCVSYYRAYASTIALERSQIMVVNSLQVLRDCADKLVTTSRLSAAGIPVPQTAIAFRRETALQVARKMGFPVVVKPIQGSWGRMIARAMDEQTFQDIIELRENMPNPQLKIHYIQQHIDKPGRDIRVFYVWGEVPVAIYRVSKNWKTNTALGGKAVPCAVTDELEDITLKTGRAMGDGVLGIDILESGDGGLMVNEVNAVIEFKNTVLQTGYNLPKKIIEETVKVLKR
ncbi:Alpha-aminoadipate--LysW ligase LysX [archaeon HR01]|nr:Alpha-aminoadipate--LysW ligase LysX [archaeon HR01]